MGGHRARILTQPMLLMNIRQHILQDTWYWHFVLGGSAPLSFPRVQLWSCPFILKTRFCFVPSNQSPCFRPISHHCILTKFPCIEGLSYPGFLLSQDKIFALIFLALPMILNYWVGSQYLLDLWITATFLLFLMDHPVADHQLNWATLPLPDFHTLLYSRPTYKLLTTLRHCIIRLHFCHLSPRFKIKHL